MTRIEELLKDCGADAIEHPGGSLLSHLIRVRQLLVDWGAREALCDAGLGHAFYGTDGFDTALVQVSNRDRVRAVLGVEAEQIVYDYASCDRKFSYAALEDAQGRFRNRFDGTTNVPAPAQRRDFVELTAANELDLMMVNADLRERYGPALWSLFSRCRAQLSPAAWQACEGVLGH